ncbi:uncharacterized protein LOC132261194 [Phlebotomus argentipes]|uniref:uncharacterized protein LOC132261194 n=1 Tax=Phlebotomus argentipes TaxID=94469 RepID=UPI002893164F|nr:uncharacterized protein LOC132261194 [Phlebotomus argentipes]
MPGNMDESPCNSHFGAVAEEIDETQSILRLNDDCLSSVLSHLSIMDLMIMEKVCLRFKSVVQMLYKTEHFALRFDLLGEADERDQNVFYTRQEIQDILCRVAPRINTVKAMYQALMSQDEDVECILTKCVNLENLYLHGMSGHSISKSTLKLFSKTFVNLRVAYLTNMNLNDDIMMECLLGATQLKTLNISCNSSIRGKFLPELQNIQEIELGFCKNIQASYFTQFLSRNPGLKSLSLMRCSFINSSHLAAIANLQNLQSLAIHNWYRMHNPANIYLLGDLPCLRHLNISFWHDFNIDPLLEKLAQRNTLESLEIIRETSFEPEINIPTFFSRLKVIKFFKWCNLTDEMLLNLPSKNTLQELHFQHCNIIPVDGIIALIQNCPELRLLSIYGLYKTNTNNLIKGILPILPERLKPLEVVVNKELFSPPEILSLVNNNPKLRMKYKIRLNPLWYSQITNIN